MTMIRLLTIGALAFASIVPGWGQNAVSPPAAAGPEPAATKKKAKAPANAWSFRLSQSGVYDTNIEQDQTDVRSQGSISLLGVRYRGKTPVGTVTLDYEVARQSFTHSTTWDRTSHDLTGSFERPVGRRWNVQTIGEVSLKGASDDREIRDEYSAVQRVEYLLSKSYRVRLDGAWRKRKYIDEPAKESHDPYLGVNLDMRWRDARRLLLGYRRDRNDAVDDKYTYVRGTWSSDVTVPLGARDALVMQAKYRVLRYPYRFVSVGGERVPRRDHRCIVDTAWEHDLNRSLKLSLGYRLETRRSNDPKREFDDTTLSTTMTYRW